MGGLGLERAPNMRSSRGRPAGRAGPRHKRVPSWQRPRRTGLREHASFLRLAHGHAADPRPALWRPLPSALPVLGCTASPSGATRRRRSSTMSRRRSSTRPSASPATENLAILPLAARRLCLIQWTGDHVDTVRTPSATPRAGPPRTTLTQTSMASRGSGTASPFTSSRGSSSRVARALASLWGFCRKSQLPPSVFAIRARRSTLIDGDVPVPGSAMLPPLVVVIISSIAGMCLHGQIREWSRGLALRRLGDLPRFSSWLRRAQDWSTRRMQSFGVMRDS